MSKIRSAVRVLLLNDDNELLLLCAQDHKITSIDGKYHRRVWFTVGGEIESGESIQAAALREIFEETGIVENEVELGPIVWFGAIDVILAGTPTCLKETFIVARTKKRDVFLTALTEQEKLFVKSSSWFSLEKIKKSNEVIYPLSLLKYLPDIIFKKYPARPIKIDLGKKTR